MPTSRGPASATAGGGEVGPGGHELSALGEEAAADVGGLGALADDVREGCLADRLGAAAERHPVLDGRFHALVVGQISACFVPAERYRGPPLKGGPVRYEPNPKHKPAAPGRRGARCPRDVDADRLLQNSTPHRKKRYATDGRQAFCAQSHDLNGDLWHGYPVNWEEVPPTVVNDWVAAGAVTRRTVRQGNRRRR